MNKIIVKHPHDVLKTKTKDIDIEDWKSTIQDYKIKFNKLFYAAKLAKGVGIAAPQIGIGESFFLFNGKIAVNPKIIWASEEKTEELEGCLSLSGSYLVPRSKCITVEYYNAALVPITTNLFDFEARVFQHEMDHLNGKVISDYAA